MRARPGNGLKDSRYLHNKCNLLHSLMAIVDTERCRHQAELTLLESVELVLAQALGVILGGVVVVAVSGGRRGL